MELLRQIDGYCERVGPHYWAEPVNAVTNAAFVIAALWMWRRSAGVPLARALCVVLALIGLGSYLFHTHAQVWSAIADVAPIAGFILLYIFAINRDVWGMRTGWALGATALFFPYAAVTVPLFQYVPVLGVSAGYLPVPALIVVYAVLLYQRHPNLARGFVIGAAILLVSLTARSVDEMLCAQIPLGTHFLWHILNGLMLGWMIEVYVRHMRSQSGANRLEGAPAPR
ncbi:ceramidase domain-containing protein [Tateyamaria sp. ANG-S1]|uniref:ceramidase domain-containing protein n=1 Tax=Tateyamaria sp. ANG-S1 TaxID=1577905 RepID=UPI00057C895A|nr:ceramidase domain-containing protein [Tateyamaria sp. ANG-S1]KIC50829.1 membrane protein [Tateyamaria sp. ANG-S1]